jgi:hypothetical protein
MRLSQGLESGWLGRWYDGDGMFWVCTFVLLLTNLRRTVC